MVLQYLKSGYQKLKEALKKTREKFFQRLNSLRRRKIDSELLEELEQMLFEADLGTSLTKKLIEALQRNLPRGEPLDIERLVELLERELDQIGQTLDFTLHATKAPLTTTLFVGVNGNGKTTSVAKLAKRLQQNNAKVLIAACDTFRAAAVEQLVSWGNRLSIEVVEGKRGSDPTAVAFDALSRAMNGHFDHLLIDTAGRLENKDHLMRELEKLVRSLRKKLPSFPEETLLVIDANCGRNGIDQAKLFQQKLPLTGIVLTKLDGSAKGGIAFAIMEELSLPIKLIGCGEKEDELELFSRKRFVEDFFHS